MCIGAWFRALPAGQSLVSVMSPDYSPEFPWRLDSNYHLPQNLIQRHAQTPVGKMATKLREIADVTNMITGPCDIRVDPIQFSTGQFLDASNAFQNGSAILPSAPEVINFAGSRIVCELHKCSNDIRRVNLVPHLFALIAKDGVGLARLRHFDQIGKKTVQLHP